MINRAVFFIFVMIFSSSTLASPWEKFTSEFKNLIESLSQLGDVAERDYTLGQMTKLHRDLLNIERSKEDLISILENHEIYKDNLSDTLSAARSSTESARERLYNIRYKVTLLSESASELEQILSDSLRSRKSWLSQVDLSNARNGKHLILEGKQAIEALKSARKELESFLRQSTKKPNNSSQQDAASGAAA